MLKRNLLSVRHNLRGFTLFEVLIAVAIVGSLSALVVVNLSRLERDSAAVEQAEILATSLRQAQLWALTGQTRAGIRPDGGWGVHIEECTAGSCTYVIFADTYPAAPNRLYDVGNDDLVQSFVVDEDVSVDSLTPLSGTSLDIVFSVPSGDVYLNGAQVATEGVIVFQHQPTSSQKTVRVSQVTGRVHIDN